MELLTDMRMELDGKRMEFEEGNLSEEDLEIEEKKVEDFLEEVKKNIFTDDAEESPEKEN